MTPPTADPVSLAISPDGQKIVFAAIVEGRLRLVAAFAGFRFGTAVDWNGSRGVSLLVAGQSIHWFFCRW